MKPDENMEFIKEIMQIFGVDINFAQRINSWAWQIDYLEMQDPFTP
jgi:hypothetical protein